MPRGDPSFSEFYAGYLAHHRHPANRALHLLAKLLAAGCVAAAAYERSLLMLLAAPVLAVTPCWLGHLWFEGNRPVSWHQPAASLLGTLGAWCGIGRGRGRGGRAESGGDGEATGGSGAGRAYYSLLADLRMCGEMLAGRNPSRSSSEPT
ncbi:MAG TPA: Mpo1-like protein [Thermoanaerobaculia bacterium]|nr:Mpo1-like protein [Thermoanaerobaculia bacterium]